MSLFGALVRTAVNVVVTVPVAVAWDVATLGGVFTGARPHTADALDQLKREAESDDD